MDALRGIAALAVLLGHIRHHAPVVKLNLRFWLVFPLDFGYAGVALFLVISGFCIHLQPAKRLAETGRLSARWYNFWQRRIYRLYPPYLAAIVLSVTSYYLASTRARAPWEHIASLPYDLLAHLLVIHNLCVDYSRGLGDSPFWTLGLEEQLYALYAIYIFVRRRRDVVRTLMIVFGVTMAWRVGAFFFHSAAFGPAFFRIGKWDDWPLNYWFLWVLGAVAAEAHAGAITLPTWCCQLRSALALAVVANVINPLVLFRLTGSHFAHARLGYSFFLERLGVLSMMSDPLLGCTCFVLINAWVRFERHGNSLNSLTGALSTVGAFSYSLYLTHIPVLMLGETIHSTGDDIASAAIRYLVYVPVCLAVAALFFVAVERHFLHPPTSRPLV